MSESIYVKKRKQLKQTMFYIRLNKNMFLDYHFAAKLTKKFRNWKLYINKHILYFIVHNYSQFLI